MSLFLLKKIDDINFTNAKKKKSTVSMYDVYDNLINKKIGHIEDCERLYYLGGLGHIQIVKSESSLECRYLNFDTHFFLLYHYHLSQPSFKILKNIF